MAVANDVDVQVGSRCADPVAAAAPCSMCRSSRAVDLWMMSPFLRPICRRGSAANGEEAEAGRLAALEMRHGGDLGDSWLMFSARCRPRRGRSLELVSRRSSGCGSSATCGAGRARSSAGVLRSACGRGDPGKAGGRRRSGGALLQLEVSLRPLRVSTTRSHSTA